MDLQVVLPNEDSGMPADRPAELARLAEDLGYGTAWLPDHLIPPGAFGEVFGGVGQSVALVARLL